MENTSKISNTHPFTGFLNQVDDPRNPDYTVHPLEEILFLLLVASLSGCDELTVVEVFGTEKLDWLRKYYPYKNGVASHDTLGRVLSRIDQKSFEKLFCAWAEKHFEIGENELVHLDGKRLRGSADKHDQNKKISEGGKYAEIIVNVYASAAGIVLAQSNVSSKLDEVSGALEVLEWLDLSGCCITGDANFCRTSIIEKILSNKADYLLTLKGNWPVAKKVSEDVFADQSIEKESFQTEETGHGRHEKRVYRCIRPDAIPAELSERFAQIKSVVQVERTRTILRKNKTENETHYYISSLEIPLEELATKIRAHWLIENQLHYVLDVSYGEDRSRLRKGNTASNQSLIRKMTLNLLSASKQKGSVKAQRLKCAISDKNRENVLNIPAMR